MDNREKAFWAAVAVAGAGVLWYRDGMRMPWKLALQFGKADRRRQECHAAAALVSAIKYEEANPGHFSPETLKDMQVEFLYMLVDNDIMGVWHGPFKRERHHPFTAHTSVVTEAEDDE